MSILSFVTGLTLPLAAAAQEPAPSAPAVPPRLVIPSGIRGYHLAEQEAIPAENGGGQAYRFTGPVVTLLSVFVYPMPEDVLVADSANRLATEANKFPQVFPIQVQRGRYDAYQMVFNDPDSVIVGTDTLPGFGAAAVTRTRQQIDVQFQFLYLVRGQFVKVRATVPGDRYGDAPIPLFARDFVRAILAP